MTESKIDAVAARAACWRESPTRPISGKIAKEVFESMWAEGKDADAIIEAKGLKQITDTGAIEKTIDEVMAANPKQLADYRSRQRQAVRLLRRSGDEGHRRQGQPGAGQRFIEEGAGGRDRLQEPGC